MFEKEITITITIGQKYVRPAGRYRYSHYQIVDTEGNNYVLGDSVFLLEFNSADDYAMIKEGKKYNTKCMDIGFDCLSWVGSQKYTNTRKYNLYGIAPRKPRYLVIFYLPLYINLIGVSKAFL